MAPKDSDDVLETVVRNDERLKLILETHRRLEKRDESLDKRIDKLSEDMQRLKTVVKELSERASVSDSRWGKVFDSAWKLGLTVLGGVILYMLNIK